MPGLLPVRSLENADVNISFLGQQQKQVPFLAKADWSIHPKWSHQRSAKLWQAWGDDGTYFRLQFFPGKDESIEFIINPDGSRVWVCWAEEKQYTTVASLLLGSVLGFVLSLRGVPCLHASVVSIDGKAIAMIGSSCAGKSTTAAALAQRGFPVLADDIAALSPDSPRHCQRSLVPRDKLRNRQIPKFWVQPGYPRLRLWGKSVNALGGKVEELPKVMISSEKRYLDLSINGDSQWQFQGKPLPLSAIYLLEKRDSTLAVPEIVPISQGEALGKLVAHVFGKTMLDKQGIARNFQQLSQLVQAVPMRRLARPDDIESLSLICDVIIDDFKQLVI